MELVFTSAWNKPTFFAPTVIKTSKSQKFLKQDSCSTFSRLNYPYHTSCSINFPTADNNGKLNKAATYLKNLAIHIADVFPEPVKKIPWRKAENMLTQWLLVLLKTAIKWSFAAFFIASVLSDVSLSISRSKELMIPFGLFVGIASAEFMKEISQELLRINKMELSMDETLFIIGSWFVALKVFLMYFSAPGGIFLSHLANGGLMQVLWLGKKLTDKKGNEKEEPSPSPSLDVSH